MPHPPVPSLRLGSPIGWISVWLDELGRVLKLNIGKDIGATSQNGPVAEALCAYLAGDFAALNSVAVAPAGSPFQQSVWAELRHIPTGEARSYADIAKALGGAATGSGANARAVGSANAANPVAIIIPCHRVIGADGSLTGYAGGLAAKEWLLRHEGWRPRQEQLI